METYAKYQQPFYILVNDLFILIIIMYIVAHKPQKEHNKQTYLQIITLQ